MLLPTIMICIGCNMARIDLHGADLHGARYTGTDLRDANLRGANLRDAKLIGCDFKGADLENADLRGAELTGASLRGADLRGARFDDGSLVGVEMQDAHLDGASFARAWICYRENDDGVADRIGCVDLRGATVNETNFRGALYCTSHGGDRTCQPADTAMLRNGSHNALEGALLP